MIYILSGEGDLEGDLDGERACLLACGGWFIMPMMSSSSSSLASTFSLSTYVVVLITDLACFTAFLPSVCFRACRNFCSLSVASTFIAWCFFLMGLKAGACSA